MKIYLVVYYDEALKIHGRCLISYYIGKIKESHKKLDLFIDSGAFSAFSKEVKIDISKYCEYIKENKKYITAYSNLDVIGNSKKTWENQRFLEKQELNPVPVFHYNEDVKWLKRYIQKGHKYIAIGGMVPVSSENLKKWLDYLWENHLTDKEGFPIVKVHGFGMTTLSLLLRYPWYSVDSALWLFRASDGLILIPRKTNNVYDFSKLPNNVLVSCNQETKTYHMNNLSVLKKKEVLEYLKIHNIKIGKQKIKEKTGKNLKKNEKWIDKKRKKIIIVEEEGIQNSPKHRGIVNGIYFNQLEKNLPQYPWKFKINKMRRLF